MTARVGRITGPLAAVLALAATSTCSCGSGSGGQRATSAAGDGAAGGVIVAGASDGAAGGSPTGGGATASGGGVAAGGAGTPGTRTPASSGSAGGAIGSPPAPDACSGLVPQLDAGRVTPRLDTGTDAYCARATSSADGTIALGVESGISDPGDMTFLLGTADGAALGSVGALFMTSRTEIDPWFHPTAAGFAGVVRDPPPAIRLRSYDRSGNALRTSGDAVVSSAPDAHGGTVLLARPYDPSVSPPYGATTVEWIDPSGLVLRTATLDDDPDLLLVSWSTDHVLTLLPTPTGLRARWYDPGGAPLTPWFDAGPALSPTDASLHLLVDGTIALADAQGWRATFRDAVAFADPPPPWLVARPGTRLATIRQGRAYAVLPLVDRGAATRPQDRFEVVTAAGESCGTVVVPPPSSVAGTAHDPTALDVGQDGTLFQVERLTGDALGAGAHCDFRWWPGALR